MVKLILIFQALFLWNPLAFSEKVEISKIHQTQRDFVFLLGSEETELEILLDCASFLHHLNVSDIEKHYIYYLTRDECWDIL